MNRLLELEKELTAVREKRKKRVAIKPRKLATATALRQNLVTKFSHGMEIFTAKGLDDGNVWIEVVPTDSTKNFSISRYTRVKDVSRKDKREYFTIMDWPNEGKKVSVKEKGTESRFKDVKYEDVGGTITYNVAKKQLTYGSSNSPIKTFMSDPLPKGTYKIMLPDAPHFGGNRYEELTPYATVWFKIEQTHDKLNRYLHVGKATAGCVTCGEESTGGTDDDRKRWTEIYNYLINRRPKNQAKYVGELKVI